MAIIQESMEIQAPVAACYDQWLKFEDFPRFMMHVRSVEHLDGNRWHWVVDGPLGTPVEWDAVMDANEQDSVISWHTVSDSMLGAQGRVHFDPIANNAITSIATRVTVGLQYAPPAGLLGEAVANLFSSPSQMLKESLKNFKQLMECTMAAEFAAESIA